MTTAPVQQQIEASLIAEIAALHLEVINESNNHNVPPGSESHFKVVMVAEAFLGQSLINRHRRINTILAQQLAGPVHALSMHLYTSAEWTLKRGDAPMSPPCLGGEN